MAKGPHHKNNQSPRPIQHVRLYDDATLSNRYELMDKLGEGSFGTVFRVKNKENNLFYAMKTIGKKPGNKSKATSLDNEVKLLKEVDHPNLIHLEEVLESAQTLYLIVELCEGGELGVFVKKNGALPEETVKKIMSKLVHALYYLHKMDIVHRDLKLENILLKNPVETKMDDFDIKVTDFGLSSKKSITGTDTLFNEYCGTPLYMAPEILENKNYSALCDVWALGVIMYYLVSGRHPYQASDEKRLLEVIKQYKPKYDGPFHDLSDEGLEFLKGMLVYDTVHRKTMGELTVHPWLTGRSGGRPNKDIITLMKEFQEENERKQRTTAENQDSSNSQPSDTSTNHSLPLLGNNESSIIYEIPDTIVVNTVVPTISSLIPSNTRNPLVTQSSQQIHQITDKTKLYVRTNKIIENIKGASRRTNPSTDTSNVLPMNSKSRSNNMTIEQSADYPPSRRTTAPVIKIRTDFNRSHSQADLLSHKQRITNASSANSIPHSLSSQNGVKHVHSSTLSHNNNNSSLPSISNNHRHHNNTISKIISCTVPSYDHHQRNETKTNGLLDKRNNQRDNDN